MEAKLHFFHELRISEILKFWWREIPLSLLCSGSRCRVRLWYSLRFCFLANSCRSIFSRCRAVVMRDFWSMSRVFGVRKYRWWRMEAERERAVVMMRMEELSECDDDEVENAELRKFHFGISFLLCFIISVFSSLSRRSRRRWDDNTKSGSRSDLLPPSSSSVNAWALMIWPHGKRWLCVDDLTMSWKFHFISLCPGSERFKVKHTQMMLKSLSTDDFDLEKFHTSNHDTRRERRWRREWSFSPKMSSQLRE